MLVARCNLAGSKYVHGVSTLAISSQWLYDLKMGAWSHKVSLSYIGLGALCREIQGWSHKMCLQEGLLAAWKV